MFVYQYWYYTYNYDMIKNNVIILLLTQDDLQILQKNMMKFHFQNLVKAKNRINLNLFTLPSFFPFYS